MINISRFRSAIASHGHALTSAALAAITCACGPPIQRELISEVQAASGGDDGGAAASTPHPPAGNPTFDPSTGNGPPLASDQTVCLENSTCHWGGWSCTQYPDIAGHVIIDIYGQGTDPSGAVSSTILEPPFHGLCFVEPGDAAPVWCEAVEPVGTFAQETPTATPRQIEYGEADPSSGAPYGAYAGVYVHMGAQWAGSPQYQYEACYLPGTLDDPSGCVDQGGYCCFPAHPLGPTYPGAGCVPGGDPFFTLYSMPDVSRAGPFPILYSNYADSLEELNLDQSITKYPFNPNCPITRTSAEGSVTILYKGDPTWCN